MSAAEQQARFVAEAAEAAADYRRRVRPAEHERRVRLSVALYKIHRQSKYYWGTTPAGEAHLLLGGTIGGKDGMSMDVGMNQTRCCAACSHAKAKQGETAWPCATVKLLLEAGVVLPLEDVEDQL